MVDAIPRTPISNGRHARPPSHSGERRAAGSLDFDILRECFSEGSAGPGIDPRKSPEIIAKRLRVSPATVRRRFTTWRSQGFLLGYDVIPNPGLLGGRLVARLMDFVDPVAQEKAIESLSLIDGMIQVDPARSTLLAVYFVDSATQSERRSRQLGCVAGTKELGPELAFEFPACSRPMSRADWRLVMALRRRPEGSLAELAKEVGQSTRTTSRRLDSLLDERALMFDPILDFSRFHQTLADLAVSIELAEMREEVVHEIRSLYPPSFSSWGLPLPDPHGKETATVHLWVTAPTSAELDALTARVAHIPGVKQVMLWYGRSTLPIRYWLDERIETILKLGTPAR
jgi:DNA-binding Lrp family transcriptional regulator